MLWKANQFFFLYFTDWGEAQLHQKKNMYFSIYDSNVKLDFSNALRSFSNALIYVLLYHTFKITENATGKEI